jgi:hypothetical protein
MPRRGLKPVALLLENLSSGGFRDSLSSQSLFQVPLAQNDQHTKEAYFGVAHPELIQFDSDDLVPAQQRPDSLSCRDLGTGVKAVQRSPRVKEEWVNWMPQVQ